MNQAPRYLPPNPTMGLPTHLLDVIHDPYAIGFRVVEPERAGPYYQCRHSAIYAVSIYPPLGLVQFSNPDGLALPLVVPPAKQMDFEKHMTRAYSRRLGHLRGEGLFAFSLMPMGLRFGYRSPRGQMWEGELAGFVTYYLAPGLDDVRFLQDGPYPSAQEDEWGKHLPQSKQEWLALCKEREALRDWLAGKHAPEADLLDGLAGNLPGGAVHTPPSTSNRYPQKKTPGA